MRLRARYDLDDIQRLAIPIAFLLFVAFLAAVGPFWFPIGIGERG